ncbi:hypothetical protein SsS58_08569 [Streptomyces scabiei]|uniref:Lipoprotein n=1 Tax=Streptomyces scabiei TaxID=1930 RepID=A0A100JYP5_STRSC|nr:hypothetical protein SsS58_08569 [Streptomyces scabiei]
MRSSSSWRRWRLSVGSVFGIALLVSCSAAGKDGDAETSGKDRPSASRSSSHVQDPYPGDEKGARALMEELGESGGTGLVRSLRPAAADYHALFQPDFARQAEAFYEGSLWGNSPQPPRPWAKYGQTEMRMWKATTDDIRAWTPVVRANFPGGYAQVKDRFKAGLAVYTWDYTKPGDERGMAYNGLVYVNGHWAFFPKPWYVLRG